MLPADLQERFIVLLRQLDDSHLVQVMRARGALEDTFVADP